MENISKFLLASAIFSISLFVAPEFILAQYKGDNCEGAALKLDGIRNHFVGKVPTQVIILIARLGKNERSAQLNRRRLYTVRGYLTAMGVKREQIITAFGEVIDGNGVVEIYTEGQLMDSITAGKNADIPAGLCDNDVEDQQKYQLPKVQPKRKKQSRK